jgi:hypothetical protein
LTLQKNLYLISHSKNKNKIQISRSKKKEKKTFWETFGGVEFSPATIKNELLLKDHVG